MALRVLVASYSQTGQTAEIVRRFLKPFGSHELDWVRIEAAEPFPFPWPSADFFDAMPETVLEIPVPLQPVAYRYEKYDLVVIGYQPWFLSPSLPVSALLRDPGFRSRMAGTPVITLSGGRNMWLNAQESVKRHIRDAGGRLVANIPLVDRNLNHVSVITIVHWLIGGKKDRMWGIFPLPGVSDEDINFVSRYGEVAMDALENGSLDQLQNRVLAFGKISVPTDILFIEERAKRLFHIWANLIRKKGTTPGKRRRLVSLFKYYLLIALFLVAPLLLGVYYLTVWPFTRKQLLRKKQYFCGVEV